MGVISLIMLDVLTRGFLYLNRIECRSGCLPEADIISV